MEAIGKHGADIAGGTDVSGLNAAAPLRGRGLHSVPAAASPSSARIEGTSDGGAALATADLRAGLMLLDSAVAAAEEELAAASFPEAADFAELTEQLSRRIEYLQLQAAAAVERTRAEAISAAEAANRAAGWTTGWGNEPETAATPDAQPSQAAAVGSPAEAPSSADPLTVPTRAVAWSPADDGSRNTVDFLRTRLRISSAEARRRLALAGDVLPRTGLAGRPMPPIHEETAAALTAGIISSRAGTTITTALDKVRHIPDPDALAKMERNLTQTAIENDQDFLTRIAHRWIDALDQDGTEPSEENLRHRQGVFIRPKRGGLYHLEIHATTDQYEVLTTVMNTATNPRTTTPDTTSAADNNGSGAGNNLPDGGGNDSYGDGENTGSATAGSDLDAAFNSTYLPDLDRRTLAQQRLDGLVGASKAALATGTLPTTGGLRPQVMVTVSYQDLLNSIQTTAANGPRYNRNRASTRPTNSPAPTNDTGHTTTNQPPGTPGWPATGPALLPGTWQVSPPEPLAATTADICQTSGPESPTETGQTGDAGSSPDSATGPDKRPGGENQPAPANRLSGINQPGINSPGINWASAGFNGQPGAPTGSGTFTYTGPVTASTIRKIACDADIIPVLLSSQGRILDIGRTTRIFPPHIRKALNARDQGCAFPNCTIPATWCEAHHITYWSQGGPTSTDNGVLLCTAHHHLIHKEQWKIHIKNGVPWFIPPPHIDPRQQPRQNHHHKT
ncbi:DUF222 domain-containing protein [Arthrobacter sp. NPDC057009]|uniref:DUF222 domain-containing protein n=1 Tax=Arthrobacter sp. NPDC057009 TaxID=3345996 RepID=UPI003626E910